MVKPFQFSRLPVIHFGSGKSLLLPDLIKKYGKSVILVTGRSSFMGSDSGRVIIESFYREKIDYYHVIIPGEPSPDSIDQPVTKFRNNKAEAVVAIGGGSVLDAGKAISAMLNVEGTVRVFLEGIGDREHPGTKVPLIAVPTTSGTGSEATRNAVISETGREGFKRSLRHDNFVPDIALVDPDLTASCPADITAASGMDCFTQLMEAFLSDRSNEYTDALAVEGITAVKRSLIKSCRNGDDPEARSDMSFAALTSGICLSNAGLGVVHGFASSVGGLYNIPHGVICGTLMAPANAITVKNLRRTGKNPQALKKYAQLGHMLLGDRVGTDDFYIDGLIDHLRQISEDLHIPRLGDYGITTGDAEDICKITELKNNPAKLSKDELVEILESRL